MASSFSIKQIAKGYITKLREVNMVEISKKMNTQSAKAEQGSAKAITPVRTNARLAAFHHEGSNMIAVLQNASKNYHCCDR